MKLVVLETIPLFTGDIPRKNIDVSPGTYILRMIAAPHANEGENHWLAFSGPGGRVVGAPVPHFESLKHFNDQEVVHVNGSKAYIMS